jgi:hypothetical protein
MKRTAKQSVVVVRDGKAVTPTIGEAFDFTDEEVEQITAMNPDALSAEVVINLTKDEAPVFASAAGGKKPTSTVGGKKADAGLTETL